MTQNQILGVDIGGSGIKGAIVDIKKGTFVTERVRIPTPSPATPKAVAEVFGVLIKELKYSGPIGCGFPSVIKNGVALTAANIDDQWINTNVKTLFESTSKQDVYIANDADLAGLAELAFGVGANGQFKNGTVIMVTIGTGLGSALFHNGQLIPNTELGHFQLNNMVAEHYASNLARKRDDLSWKSWGIRFNSYLSELSKLFWPDAIILGGGGSKYFDSIQEHITLDATVIPAKLGNHAGIIGAAVYAKTNREKQERQVVKI